MWSPQAPTPPFGMWVTSQRFKRKCKGFQSQLSHFQRNVIYVQSLFPCAVPVPMCTVYKSNSLPHLTQPRYSPWLSMLACVSGDLSLVLVLLLKSILQMNLRSTSLILHTSFRCQRPFGAAGRTEEGIDRSRSGGSKDAWKSRAQGSHPRLFFRLLL